MGVGARSFELTCVQDSRIVGNIHLPSVESSRLQSVDASTRHLSVSKGSDTTQIMQSAEERSALLLMLLITVSIYYGPTVS